MAFLALCRVVLPDCRLPRFAYEKVWGNDEIVYEAPFYTVARHNYDTDREYIEVI